MALPHAYNSAPPNPPKKPNEPPPAPEGLVPILDGGPSLTLRGCRYEARPLNWSDVNALVRIVRDAFQWGARDIVKIREWFYMLGDMSVIGQIISPLMGIPEVESQFTFWLGSVWVITQDQHGKIFEPPYVPVGEHHVGKELRPKEMLQLIHATSKHGDIYDFFTQFGIEWPEQIRTAQVLWSRLKDLGNEQLTKSKNDMDGETGTYSESRDTHGSEESGSPG